MASTSSPDMSLINELYEEMERNPPAIEARKILVQQLMAVGWLGAAGDEAKNILEFAPNDVDALRFLSILPKIGIQPSPVSVSKSKLLSGNTPSWPLPPPSLPSDLDAAKLELERDYKALRSNAQILLRDSTLLRDLTWQKEQATVPSKVNPTSWDRVLGLLGSLEHSLKGGLPVQKEKGISTRFEKHIPDLENLANGRVSTVVRGKTTSAPVSATTGSLNVRTIRAPLGARSVARTMKAEPDKAVEIAFNDLSSMIGWLKSSQKSTEDDTREAMVKRVKALKTNLPENLHVHADSAQMHVEHEILHRVYIVTETMYGDPVVDIPRSNFLVTEDGYPWDLDELADAITANSGVMRNPISKQMFTANDIRAIVRHPLGKRLAALGIEQSKLRKGVRPKTIELLDKMSYVLLQDQSDDQMASRHEVDAFAAYVATLPQSEQDALDRLRVPAKDSHTGQAFDATIGEAVKDAIANRICFHKAGDLLKQAAAHLRSGK